MKTLLPVLALLSALSLRTMAAGTNTEVDPLMKLATARAKVEISLRDATAVFDKTRNGYVAAETVIEKTRNQIMDILSKAKTERDEDKKFVIECERRAAQIDRKWDDASREYDTDISPRYDAATETFDKLKNIFGKLTDLDQNWKDARLDLAALEAAFAAMDKRIADTAAQGEKATNDLKDRQKIWGAELAAVEKFVAQPAEKDDGEKDQKK
jgi:hypothetical protein